MVIEKQKDDSKQQYCDKKIVALTFDDGPNLDITPLILDKLEFYGVKATFFLCGEKINDNTKTVMERQLLCGCELANHSWSHPYMNQLLPEEIVKQIEDTNQIILKKTGVTPQFFRPPYIATNQEMFDFIELPFINGVSCADWEDEVGVESRVSSVLNQALDGDIILLHDFSGNLKTVDAMDQIIIGLQRKGFEFVTVSELFQIKKVNPHVKNKLWTNVND